MNSTPRGQRIPDANTSFFTPQLMKMNVGQYPIHRERHHSAPDWHPFTVSFINTPTPTVTTSHTPVPTNRYRYFPVKSPQSRKRRGPTNEQVDSPNNEPDIKRKRNKNPPESIPKALRTDKFEKVSCYVVSDSRFLSFYGCMSL